MIVINGLNPVGDIEDHVADLANDGLPASAIVACLIRYAEAGPLLLALLTRAADDEVVDDIDVHQFFNVIHIVAGARDKRAFAPLLRLLRRPDDELDPLLGAAISTLSRIAIGTFDGDSKELFKAILDRKMSELNRAALFDAATYLTWEGRIKRDEMTKFLEGFESTGESHKSAVLWSSWFISIALLGLRELEPAMQRVRKKGVIPDDVDLVQIAELLDEAQEMHNDAERFDLQDLGHIDNVLETLQLYSELDEAYDEMVEDEADDMEMKFREEIGQRTAPFELQAPIANPMRKVGRNDLCPCGSGKKAKRCCLAA